MLMEQFTILTSFLGKTAPTSERAGSYTDGSTENIVSQVKTKSLIKK